MVIPKRPASPKPRPALAPEDFNPRLRVAYLFSLGTQLPAGRRLNMRRVLDYEMEFMLESQGSEIIDGVHHPIHKGDVVFRRPGQLTQGIMPYRCLTIIFELDGRGRERPDSYFDALLAPGTEPRWEIQPNFKSDFLDVIPSVFPISAGDGLRTLFESALKHHISPGEGSELLCKASILQILFRLHTEVMDPLRRGKEGNPADDASARYQRLETLLAYMRKHFRRKLPLKEMAQVAGLSPTWLHRIFSETMGETPLEHLNRLRMDAARELLATSNLSASSVATECGFENVPYFFTLFKRACGDTPAGFRSKHQFPS